MKNNSVLVYGEVLFDVFEDGQAILGGAPFNVAWHLHGFGANPLFVSRIGADENARQVLANMQAWGMNCDGLQQDDEHATGLVSVNLVSGQPQYLIRENMAYDHIDWDSLNRLLENHAPSLIYHGSLINRQEVSRATLMQLKKRCNAPVFVDINLRAPWHHRQKAEPLLQDISWLKINESELAILVERPCRSDVEAEVAARELLQRYKLKFIVVTLGHRGAFCIHDDRVYRTDSPATEDLIDTVGAGDALSSVIILGILQQWDLQTSLQRGVEFASAICEQQGATQLNNELYHTFSKRWHVSKT